ncbi:LysM peptidoglycan-binding domain-containing protein [Henriciella aquimarina]|uniref:LysM peptidoglycan-binding domain-containing protein n=1 Tax=Henriciella aquimarina TaxID=545261 RepID=UPI001179AA6E|nr:LysM peptidoglycan-binding domain-containing protein [Henriciella aquimarina]
MTRLMAKMAIFATLLAGACTHTPQAPEPVAVDTVEEAAQTPVEAYVPEAIPTERERVRRAIQLLGEGEESLAMVELEAILADDPDDAIALKLREQIETDPVELLGESHTPHMVETGETTSSLAKTFLGDALLFYALSRYNELEAPNRLMAGQTLKMPDDYGERPDDLPQEVVEAVTIAAWQPSESVVTPSGGTSKRDVAAANTLRLEALEQLNAGHAERAVTLLERARTLDGDNPKIAADLAKVERIQAALSQSE